MEWKALNDFYTCSATTDADYSTEFMFSTEFELHIHCKCNKYIFVIRDLNEWNSPEMLMRYGSLIIVCTHMLAACFNINIIHVCLLLWKLSPSVCIRASSSLRSLQSTKIFVTTTMFLIKISKILFEDNIFLFRPITEAYYLRNYESLWINHHQETIYCAKCS